MNQGRQRNTRSRAAWVPIVAVSAAALLALSGCSPAPDSSASAVQAESFPDVYAQTIDWHVCGPDDLDEAVAKKLVDKGVDAQEFECAMVEAPMNWDAPKNRERIELAVNRRAATGAEKPLGTMLMNPGGPGASGMELAFRTPVMKGSEGVFERYNVLGFDPRGIGRSTPLQCEESSDILEVNIAVCADEQPLAHSMGTSQVARDMDLLRTLEGDDRMNYMGYSYGTVLGATYATIFPERVGRMVLDSALGASWAGLQSHFDQSVAIVNSVDAMLGACEVGEGIEACPISGEADLIDAMGALNEAPVVASDGTEIDGNMLYGYLMSGLYGIPERRQVTLGALGGLMRGDQAAADTVAEDMSKGGAAVGLSGSIVSCHSFPQDPDVVGLLEHIEEDGIPELLGGPEVNDETIDQFVNLFCDALPTSGDDITDSFSGSPDHPILVIGITGDHATPYEGSKELVKELGNARLLTLEGSGHGASFAERSQCVNDATAAYLLEGELPKEGAVCESD